jgi:hypothetical protein
VTRRLELGPLVVALGALLLLVSLFLNWYEPNITAWDAFEVWDLVLAALGVFSLVLAMGLVIPELALLESPALLANATAITVIVASQIINQPPAAAGQGRMIGCWLALGSAALIVLGTLLTLSRIRFAIAVEGRDTRRRVVAVDTRDPSTTESGLLFSRPAPVQPEAEPGVTVVEAEPTEPEPAAEPETEPVAEEPPAQKPRSRRS